MMVDAIRLQNFMGFQDTDWLELRPISLLFGKNSSGKSCIARALRLLKQSRTLGTAERPLVFSVQDGLDLGDFLTAMYRIAPVERYRPIQQEQRDQPVEPPLDIPLMTFHFRCSLPDSVQAIRERVSKTRRIPPVSDKVPLYVDLSVTFRCTVKQDSRDRRSHSESIELWSFALKYSGLVDAKSDPIQVFAAERIELLSQPNEPDLTGWYYWSDILPIYADESSSRVWQEMTIGLTSGFLPHIDDFNQMPEDIAFVSRILKESERVVGDFLVHVQYVGPIRPMPQRWYVLDQEMQKHWEGQGWSGFAQYLGDKVQNQIQIEEIDEWIERLELGTRVRVKQEYSESWAVVAQVNLDDFGDADRSTTDAKLNLADVGFGMGQVLPIIVQCLTARRDSLIIIEQPELHLHPSAQAKLGDLFIQVINRLSTDKPLSTNGEYVPYARFVIETHSEHLLLRLQKRIAMTTAGKIPTERHEQMLLPSQLAIYFINRQDETSTVVPIEVGPYGDLLSTPTGFEEFFSDDLIETAERMRARLSDLRKGS